MTKRLMLLVNPTAGRSGYRNCLSDVLEAFYSSGHLPTVFFTTAPGDATRLVLEHSKGFDIVVCMGGDGTLSEVISGIIQTPEPPDLGYIPLGTANDVASSLNLPRRPQKAAQRIIEGSPFAFDVGRYGDDQYFAYIAAFGAFTEVSYQTPASIKHNIGYLAYLLEGMRHISRINYRKATIEYDDGVIIDDFIFGAVSNSTSIAGLVKLNDTTVELGDGLFEVILIKNPRRLSDMNGIISDITSRKYTSNNVIVLHSKYVRFTFDQPVALTRDGENGGIHRDLTLRNLHAAIRLIV